MTKPVEETLADLLLSRRDVGVRKYGVTVDQSTLTTSEWIQHAIEEALDFAVYLERLKRDVAASEAKIATMEAEIADLKARLARIQAAAGHPTTKTLTRDQLKVARKTPYPGCFARPKNQWTVFDVLNARRGGHGCCTDHANNRACDCLETARWLNGTGCSICSNPKCDDPCGKH